MPTTRFPTLFRAAWAALMLLAGCGGEQAGPVRVIAIGPDPQLVNPNRAAVSPGSALLLEAVAQGLVRFDAAGEIEPALAQSWIVSDDGLRYTFRLRPAVWARGDPVTAAQVVARLNAAIARDSRNGLKPVLGVIDEIEAMTERVLEIRLKSPRPNFLQLLAQPELAIVANGQGTGPYRLGSDSADAVRLVPPPPDEDADVPVEPPPDILLSGAPAARAIAIFAAGDADLVIGGTLGDLPLLTAGDIRGDASVFDPARGLFGLAFARADGALADAAFRRALSMAIDRDALAGRFPSGVLQPRSSILPPGLSEQRQPATPAWADEPMATRRELAARAVAALDLDEAPRLRVALPEGLGYRIVFAQIRRDWRAIGLDAVAVPAGAPADLRLVDEVAPADLASWYLRHFLCGLSPVCDESASLFIEAARLSPTAAQRQRLVAEADRNLTATTAFIPLAAPVRWSLRGERLNGFRANVFARHDLSDLVDPER